MTMYYCKSYRGDIDGMRFSHWSDAYEHCEALRKSTGYTWSVEEMEEQSTSEQRTGSYVSNPIDLSWIVWILILLYLFG